MNPMRLLIVGLAGSTLAIGTGAAPVDARAEARLVESSVAISVSDSGSSRGEVSPCARRQHRRDARQDGSVVVGRQAEGQARDTNSFRNNWRAMPQCSGRVDLEMAQQQCRRPIEGRRYRHGHHRQYLNMGVCRRYSDRHLEQRLLRPPHVVARRNTVGGYWRAWRRRFRDPQMTTRDGEFRMIVAGALVKPTSQAGSCQPWF
jgi:hypothetical protein